MVTEFTPTLQDSTMTSNQYTCSMRDRNRLRIPNRPHNLRTILISPSREEVEEDGKELFQNFVREEIHKCGLSESEYLSPSSSHDSHLNVEKTHASGDFVNVAETRVCTPVGYRNAVWMKYGRNLRECADKFAQSKQRDDVRKEAEKVNLEEITKDRFFELLTELFFDGFSRERLIALFFFCVDLVIKAIHEHEKEICKKLFEWSLIFICEKVCAWVEKKGGWGKVLGNLGNMLMKIAIGCAAVTITAAAIIYIKKNW